MTAPSGAVVRAIVAGLEVCCSTEEPEVARRFFDIAPPTELTRGLPQQVYEVFRDAAGGLVVRTAEGLLVERTSYPGNAVAAIELDVRRAAERHYPKSLWLHAAGLVHPDGRSLLCLGTSGVGKSTAALLLLNEGWQYLADDAVLVDPIELEFRGLGWSLKLEELPLPRASLEAVGFAVSTDEWVLDSGQAVSSFRLKPPTNRVCGGGRSARLTQCLFLERGPVAVTTLTVGQALLKLWPQRVVRSDGSEPWEIGSLAARLATVRFGLLRTERIEQLCPAVADWTRRTEMVGRAR